MITCQLIDSELFSNNWDIKIMIDVSVFRKQCIIIVDQLGH